MPLSEEQQEFLKEVRTSVEYINALPAEMMAVYEIDPAANAGALRSLLSIIDTLQADAEAMSWATIEHRGYVGVAAVDFEGGIIYGRVKGKGYVLTFEGATPAEAAKSFRDTVDDYLAWCAEKGEEPGTPNKNQEPT